MLESFFNEVVGLQSATLLKKETPAQLFSSEFCEIFHNTYQRKAASDFSITKAEDCSLHTYHFTLRDSTTTAQTLANNFWSSIYYIEQLYRPPRYLSDIFSWTVCFCNILMKMSVKHVQCLVELQATDKTPITSQNRNFRHKQFDETLKCTILATSI